MNPTLNTIIPRTPLTVTELETLATMLDNGSRHMCDAKNSAGHHVWPSGNGTLRDAMEDMFAGFFQLRDNTAILAAGPDGWPYDLPHARIGITASA